MYIDIDNFSYHFTAFSDRTCYIDDIRYIGSGNPSYIKIPEKLYKNTVYKIKPRAYNERYFIQSIKTVYLPYSISELMTMQFYRWKNLEEIKFYGDKSLINKNYNIIYDSAFMECHKLKIITIPEHFNILTHDVFYILDNLKYIIIKAKNAELHLEKSFNKRLIYMCPNLKMLLLNNVMYIKNKNKEFSILKND